MGKSYKWGIIGPGKIAAKFAASLQQVPGAVLQAIASRDKNRARQFAQQFGAKTTYTDYTELVRDTEVDIVYIATPHSFHHAHALLCLQHKKPVVCEKPLTLTYASAQEMVAAARNANVFFMEGMWTRFFPAIHKTVELIKQGAIGDVKFLQADFGFNAPFDTSSRLFDVKLGGGSLFDVGVYPLFLALLILGEPSEVQSKSHLSSTGADEQTSITLYYNSGQIASLHSSIVTSTPIQAVITGTKGSITLPSPWFKPNTVVFKKDEQEAETFSFPYTGFGFECEIQEVMHCLDNGLLESPLMPLNFSLLMSRTLDTVCRQNDLQYEL